MLIIQVKPGENIDRAIKKYRNKVRSTKQNQKLRSNEFFTKKSVELREVKAKAKYKQFKKDIEEN